ncbi:MAG: hypothetical protein HPY55_14125 [Firmicutes bacterium]|nr:hypothetical protein [Bacillota bacterium]
MKATLAVLVAVAKCLIVSPFLYLTYFWFFVHSNSHYVHMTVSGLILLTLGFASGRMVSRELPHLLLWLPGALLVLGLTGGWWLMVYYMYRGRGPALTDVLFLFINLVNRSALTRRTWLAAAMLLPIIGSVLGGTLTSARTAPNMNRDSERP